MYVLMQFHCKDQGSTVKSQYNEIMGMAKLGS